MADMTRSRDRSDELELIISGLTMLVLFMVPSWIYQQAGLSEIHYGLAVNVAMQVIMVILPPLCYALSVCFLMHLISRAYWIGLIGLQNSFPDGINWERNNTLGPISSDFLRRHLTDLPSAIRRADCVAASLFAIISLIGLVVLWWLIVFTPIVVLVAVVGEIYGRAGLFIDIANSVIVGFILGCGLVPWFLDAVLARRWPRLQSSSAFRRVVLASQTVVNFIFPSGLIQPAKLTLQSNTWPISFSIILGVLFLIVLTSGPYLIAQRFSLAPYGAYTLLGPEAVSNNFRSSHYENMRVNSDARLYTPMIPADTTSASFLRLLIPFYPSRDQIALKGQCEDMGTDELCVRKLWQVQLDDGPMINLAGFMPAERRDMNMRGLQGYIPLQGLAPGLHTLHVNWLPLSVLAGRADDFIPQQAVRYTIPFVFAPDFELDATQAPLGEDMNPKLTEIL